MAQDEKLEANVSQERELLNTPALKMFHQSMVEDLRLKQGLWQALRRRGCQTMTEFIERNPEKSFFQIADELSVFPILVLETYAREAVEHGRVRDYAKQYLVRQLFHEAPTGWPGYVHDGVGRPGRKAFPWPYSELRHYGASEADHEAIDRTWHVLLELHPPVGWLPKDVDDALLRQAFDVGWPE